MGTMTRWHVVAVGLLVVGLLIPVWAAYGALTPKDDHGNAEAGSADAHASGMSGMEKDQSAAAAAFLTRAQAYAAEHGRDDGAVQAMAGMPIPLAVFQFGFLPRVLHMQTGETYTLELLSKDVVHGFSLQMGTGSLNAVLMPGMITTLELTPTQPGEYLFLCNEYCGAGHQFMSGKIVVEGPARQPGASPSPAPPGDPHRPH